MNTNRISITALAVLAAAAIAGGAETGQEPPPPPPHRMDAPHRGRPADGGYRIMERLLLRSKRLQQELGLSEEQVATMKEAAETFRAKHKEWGEKMKAAAVEQARLISEPTVDEEAVMKAVEAVGAVHIEMAKLRTRHLLALRGMLTADQREKLRQFADNMRERGPRKPRGDREEEPRRRRPRRGPREEQPAEPPEVF